MHRVGRLFLCLAHYLLFVQIGIREPPNVGFFLLGGQKKEKKREGNLK
jgi:hypothetical protein